MWSDGLDSTGPRLDQNGPALQRWAVFVSKRHSESPTTAALTSTSGVRRLVPR